MADHNFHVQTWRGTGATRDPQTAREDHHGVGEPSQAAAPLHSPLATRPCLTDEEGQCGPWICYGRAGRTVFSVLAVFSSTFLIDLYSLNEQARVTEAR